MLVGIFVLSNALEWDVVLMLRMLKGEYFELLL